MPLYQCLVPAGSLNAELRADLAEAITTVHTSVTGAPRGFVNVVFTEYEPSTFFTAGKPREASYIDGTIRAGRDRAARAELLTRLSEAWTAITGQDARSLLLGLTEVDPTSLMEAGLIVPAPGEEAAWMHRHRHVLGDVLSAD
ncbi:phenylpyruvate tautomerase PptA (4-oxalocrotonate tautomerase family) [Streptomyces sp. LBL]|uniref:tautomerase family protein n=1 Tax=Streptomyces sp. LBL TaxID=2940562 RepID=UPI002475E877|nr:tautomerase family protein [Streptomyces sp. LBL]MDH6630307.1 phenylpyruvate tautomerase PptA (4-oxalocrotonate tautomerase family) [Streptomyces sp. LBL]